MACFFDQYLGREYNPDLEVPDSWNVGEYFLLNCDQAKVVRIGENTSTVEVEFSSTDLLRYGADCVAKFELSRDGLLISMTRHLQRDVGNKNEKWGYRFKATSPFNFEGVWIPTQYELVVWTSRIPELATRHRGAVREIQIGKLAPADLILDFPPDTEVRDEVSGTLYSIGQDGLPAPYRAEP